MYLAGRHIQGAFIVNSATAGVINFTNASPAGTALMKLGTVASATVSRDITVPDDGVVFPDGVYTIYSSYIYKYDSISSVGVKNGKRRIKIELKKKRKMQRNLLKKAAQQQKEGERQIF